MTAPALPPIRPSFVAVGDNKARAFGMAASVRAAALAAKAGMDPADSAAPGRAVVLADLDFAWDPAWAAAIAKRPGTALIKDGRAVLAHLPDGADAGPIATAMLERRPLGDGLGLDVLDADRAEL